MKYPGISVFYNLFGSFWKYKVNNLSIIKSTAYEDMIRGFEFWDIDAIIDIELEIEEFVAKLLGLIDGIVSIILHTKYIDCVGSLNFLS